MCSHAGWGWAQSCTCGGEEVLHLLVRAGCFILIPPPCFLLVPCVSTHVSSVPCHLSSRIRVMNRLHLGHFWNCGDRKKKKAHCCCSFSDGKQAMLLMFHKTDRHHSGQRCASFLGRGRCTCKQGHSPPGMVEEGVKGGDGKSPFSAVKTKDL